MLARLRRTQRAIEEELVAPHTSAKTRKLLKKLSVVVATLIEEEQRSADRVRR